MASAMGPGDVGVNITLNEQQAVQGAQRTQQALDQLDRFVQKLGGDIDKALGYFEKTAAATQGMHELAKAEQEAAEAARKAAQEHAKHHEAMRKQQQALQDMKTGLMQVAAAAGVMSYAMQQALSKSLDAYKEQRNAIQGLESVSTRTIGNSGAAKQAVQDMQLVEDALLNVSEASKAVQAGLATGFSLDETINLIQAFGDAATYNRQAGLQFGESVVRAMEGVRMGNSVLSDAAGITKNLSQILKEAGYAEQDLQKVSSDAAVRRALYNGLLKEATLFQGNAAKAAQELTGAESRTAVATFNAAAAMGESLAPAIHGAHEAIAPLIRATGTWVEQNPALARSLFLVVGGTVAFTGALAGLTVAALAANAALGPIGWTVVGIGAASGALAGYVASVAASGHEAERTKTSISALATQYEAAKRAVDEATAAGDDNEDATRRMREAADKLREINPELVNGWNLNKQAIDDMNLSLDDAIKKAERWQSVANVFKSLYGLPTTPEGELQQAQSELQRLTDQYNRIKARDADQAGKMGDPEEAAQLLAQANAQTEAIWGPKLAEAQRKVNALTAQLYGPTQGDWIDQPIQITATPPAKGTPTGDGKMSPALAAALEDLQDVQALDRNAENLKAVLAKVRQILSTHGAELVKLGKDRDLIRQRDITLPDQIAQAEYQAAMAQLDADRTLKNMTPEKFAEGLRGIQQRFAAYLKDHPDLALQMDLKLKGASEEELRAPLERWRSQFRMAEELGLLSGSDGLDLKMRYLQEGRSLAATAGDKNTLVELVGQIKDTQQALQQANFEAKFEAIGAARDRAFAGAADRLATMERQLIDEESRGDKADPARIQQIRQQMLDAVRPALQAQRDALQALYDSIKGTDEQAAQQRAQVEAELNQVKQSLLDQDVQAHRIAADAKVAAERTAADKRKKLIEQQKTWIQELADTDLTAIRQRHEADEKAQQARIKGLQDTLSALERQWAAEDRREQRADLQAQLDAVMADTRFQKVDAGGNLVWTYDEERARELREQLADHDRETQRQTQRQALQDQIDAAQRALDAMRTANQTEEAERQRFWQTIQAADLTAYAELTTAAETGLAAWAGVFSGKLDGMLTEAKAKRDEINKVLDSIGKMGTGTAGTSATTGASIPAPTLPASLPQSLSVAASTAVSIGQILLPNVTNPLQFMAALPAVAAQAGATVNKVIRTARGAVSTL